MRACAHVRCHGRPCALARPRAAALTVCWHASNRICNRAVAAAVAVAVAVEHKPSLTQCPVARELILIDLRARARERASEQRVARTILGAHQLAGTRLSARRRSHLALALARALAQAIVATIKRAPLVQRDRCADGHHNRTDVSGAHLICCETSGVRRARTCRRVANQLANSWFGAAALRIDLRATARHRAQVQDDERRAAVTSRAVGALQRKYRKCIFVLVFTLLAAVCVCVRARFLVRMQQVDFRRAQVIVL